MFCKNCGRQLDEGESYCPICGTVNSPEAPIAPGTPFYGEPDERVKSDMAGKTLTWGILSVDRHPNNLPDLPKKNQTLRKP